VGTIRLKRDGLGNAGLENLRPAISWHHPIGKVRIASGEKLMAEEYILWLDMRQCGRVIRVADRVRKWRPNTKNSWWFLQPTSLTRDAL
jgi:hypothetical protein